MKSMNIKEKITKCRICIICRSKCNTCKIRKIQKSDNLVEMNEKEDDDLFILSDSDDDKMEE